MADSNFNFFLELLEDESDKAASIAMSELLRCDTPELDSCLSTLQDSSSPKLRRRIHQLQSALTMRRKRRFLEAKLSSGSLPLGEGCIQLHLIWFDNDQRNNVIAQLRELREDFMRFSEQLPTLRKLGSFMAFSGYTVPSREDIEPEYYCVGSVLDDKLGSDLVFCAICAIICDGLPLNMSIVRRGLDFAVTDHLGQGLFPGNSWQLRSADEMRSAPYHIQSDTAILRFIAAILFVCAVGTDAFRYVHTTGRALSSIADCGALDFLPYPYGNIKNPTDLKK